MHFQATPEGIVPASPLTPAAPERRNWLKRLGLLLGGGWLASRAQAAPHQVQGDGDFIGQIILFAGTYPPRNYAFCDGALLSVSSNTALFTIIGTYYGGNGQTNFALPDLRGRVPVHVGSGAGSGLSPYMLGQAGGVESVTLTTNQMPAHTHQLQGTTAAGTAASPADGLLANDGRGGPQYGPVPTTPTALNNQSIANAGGNQGHENRPPFLGLNYCICIAGLYPTRN